MELVQLSLERLGKTEFQRVSNSLCGSAELFPDFVESNMASQHFYRNAEDRILFTKVHN